MNEEDLAKLGENAIDIAEAFMGGGGHESNTDVLKSYLKEEYGVEFESDNQAEDLSLACQSAIEEAIYTWIKLRGCDTEHK